jgi:hypothetical protein
LWEYAKNNSTDFDSFVRNCTETIYESPFERKSFFFNQLDYLTDENGNLLVDFIGRFESVEDDFRRMSERAKLPEIQLQKINVTSHRDYRKYYTPASREIVEQRYKRDLEYFGYEF